MSSRFDRNCDLFTSLSVVSLETASIYLEGQVGKYWGKMATQRTAGPMRTGWCRVVIDDESSPSPARKPNNTINALGVVPGGHPCALEVVQNQAH